MAVTRALRFSDHVTKRNGGSGDENDMIPKTIVQTGNARVDACAYVLPRCWLGQVRATRV